MDEKNCSSPAIQAQGIVNLLSEPVLILSDALVVVLANPAFYDTLGVSPGELEGRSVEEFAKATNGQRALRAIAEFVLALGHKEERAHLDCIDSSGADRTFSVTARRLIPAEESGAWILVELRDITADRELERRFRELNEALIRRGAELERINSDLESFNRWVSHDLRTPLRFTNTIVHRLLETHGPALPPAVLDAIRMILDSTREMGKLIENLLAFSQLDRVPLKRRRTNIARLARKALAELQAENRPPRQTQVIIDELPACYADSALLKQVLLNLLSNAIVFTNSREQAEIRVGFEENEDGGTVYFVRDNGVGFKMSDAELLFRPFHRLSRAQSPRGMGVGLTLVQRIIERHGGRIWAEGEPDRGATFYFQLKDETAHDNHPLAGKRNET